MADDFTPEELVIARETAPELMRALCACVDVLWLRGMSNDISPAEAQALRQGGMAILAVRLRGKRAPKDREGAA